MRQSFFSRQGLIVLLGCAALLLVWTGKAGAQPDVYKPIREMWTVPIKAWQRVQAEHIKHFMHPMTGTPTAKLFSPIAHLMAWAETGKNSVKAQGESLAAVHRAAGTLHLWAGSYHQGRALGTGMTGRYGASLAHQFAAGQHEAMSKLHMGTAKVLDPKAETP